MLFAHAFQFALDHLQFVERGFPIGAARLGDLCLVAQAELFKLVHLGLKPTDLALRLDHRALKRVGFGLADQPVLEQLGLGFVFLGQQFDQPLMRRELGLVPDRADIERVYITLEQREVVLKRGPCSPKGDPLSVDDLGDFRIVPRLVQKVVREMDILEAVVLGQQARGRCFEPCLPGGQFAPVGQRGRLVEPQDDIAFLDNVAFADDDLRDDAALEVLHDLVAAGGDETALRDHGRSQRRAKRPGAETAEGHDHETEGEDHMLSDRTGHIAVPFAGFGKRGGRWQVL